MRRRAKSPFPGPPDAMIRWVAVDAKETHSVDAPMSATLMHFVDPLLSVVAVPADQADQADQPDGSSQVKGRRRTSKSGPKPAPESVEAVFTIGVVVWNLGSYETPEWKAISPFPRDPIKTLRALADQPGSPEGLFQIAEGLLHRRRTLFGKDRRVVADFKLLPDPEAGFRLRCQWALPGSASGAR